MPDLQPYYSWIGLAVLLLIVLIAITLILRLMGGRVRGRRGSRLGILEYHDIDKTRRLVLLRRDDIEHLVLIGGHQDLVIESGIETGLAGRGPIEMQRHNEPTLPLRPAPRPAVFGSRRPNLRPVDNNPGDPNDDGSNHAS
jgi:flagellar protein FliO/FliZ